MQRQSATRPFNIWVILATLGLAFCVFAWGLQYKLSLYDPPQAASDKIPQAKLLSKNEQSGIAEGPQVVRAKIFTRVRFTVPTNPFPISLSPLRILSSQASSHAEHRTNHSWHLRRGLLNTFFVRPPPILA